MCRSHATSSQVTAVTVYCLKYYKVYSRFYSASLLSKLQLEKVRILYWSTVLLYASLSQSSGNRRFVGLAHSHQAPKLLLVLVEAKEFEVTEPLFKLRS